MLNIKTNKQ